MNKGRRSLTLFLLWNKYYRIVKKCRLSLWSFTGNVVGFPVTGHRYFQKFSTAWFSGYRRGSLLMSDVVLYGGRGRYWRENRKKWFPKIPARATHIYGDLMLFHLVIGAMYLAKEEMTYEGKNVSAVRKLLKQYGSDPFVRKTLTIWNCLHYVVQIKSVFWKLLSFTLVLFLRLHAYGFLSAILVFMSGLGIDSL